MRDLTLEELKLAPDWATHYEALDSGYIIFQNDIFSVWYDLNSNAFDERTNNEFLNDLSELNPINKADFDEAESVVSEVEKLA